MRREKEHEAWPGPKGNAVHHHLHRLLPAPAPTLSLLADDGSDRHGAQVGWKVGVGECGYRDAGVSLGPKDVLLYIVLLV
jgi:hypothetical protein